MQELQQKSGRDGWARKIFCRRAKMRFGNVFGGGCGFRRIAIIMSKLFGKYYRHQTVVNWIKRAGLKVLSAQTKQEKVEVLEMDELYTYVKKKSEKQGFGVLLIGKRCALLRLK